MSRDMPNVEELLGTVDEYLGAIAANSNGRPRYDALCAQYLLQVVAREIAHGQDFDELDRSALDAFSPEASSENLRSRFDKLSQEIRAGKHDERWDEVFDIAFEHIRRNVAISRPDKLED